MYPKLKVDRKKLEHNINFAKKELEKRDINLCCVTKGFSAKREIVDVYYENGIREFADSRIENLKTISYVGIKRWLIRIPMLSEVKDVVKYSDISLNSQVEIVKALGKEATRIGVIHNVILMIDLGDLREGVRPEKAVEVAGEFLKIEGIHLLGIGVNFNCFGGIIPTEKNIEELILVADEIEKEYDIKLEVISGGNSGTIYMVQNNTLDKRVNNLRCGDVIIEGLEASYLSFVPEMEKDIFTFEAEVIEVEQKPSCPIGESTVNAFGDEVTFEDKGIMKRAIIGCGKQDVEIDKIVPIDKDIECIGTSSDHIIVDCTKKGDIKVGDIIEFYVTYSAILSATTSKYVTIEIV